MAVGFRSPPGAPMIRFRLLPTPLKRGSLSMNTRIALMMRRLLSNVRVLTNQARPKLLIFRQATTMALAALLFRMAIAKFTNGGAPESRPLRGTMAPWHLLFRQVIRG